MKAVSAPNLRRAPVYVLITGGCGFIGSNLADALAARGERVVVFDGMTRKGAEENACWLKTRWRNRVEVVTGDVRERDAIDSVVADCGAVLHLAAQVAVTTSLDDPVEDFSINARGTLNVLESIRRHCPSSPLIFASTNKVYGKPLPDDGLVRRGRRYEPIDSVLSQGVAEDVPLDLYSPYGCSKGAADQYVHDYARVFGLRTVVLRMSCIYGPRQFGTEDQGWLAHFLIKAMQADPITIYGDGLQVRDALYVDDAVNAWIMALDGIGRISGGIFNLGGGPANALSLLEAVDRIAELRGERPRLRFEDWRPGDQRWYVSDTGAISAALGWSPRIPLRKGLRQLDSWISDRFGNARRMQEAAV